MLLNCALLLGIFLETFALQWTSSTTFPNGTRVNVCVGDNVTLPWTFDVTSSEHVIDVEWYQVYQNREIPLAAYISDQFMTYGDLDRHLYFVPNAGLQLLGVTSSDMEMCTVRVNVNGVIQPFSQRTFLDEPEAPVTVDGRLDAYILPVTQFSVINGESHLQLGCGHFQSLGEPPISVTWRTPSAQLRSSTYNNSVFVLTLSNPIEGGNYTCQLNGVSTVETCLQNNPLFHAVATVYVDDVTSTLILLRNDMKWLREENLRITEENARLSEENARLSETITTQSELLNLRLANLHVMTSGKTAILRVDLMDFNGTTAYAMFNTFSVSGPEDNYTLTLGGYNGTAGDGLQTDINMQFSTYEREYDADTSLNCTEYSRKVRWFNECYSNLNGRYYSIGVDNVWWLTLPENFQSLKRVEFKIRV